MHGSVGAMNQCDEPRSPNNMSLFSSLLTHCSEGERRDFVSEKWSREDALFSVTFALSREKRTGQK